MKVKSTRKARRKCSQLFSWNTMKQGRPKTTTVVFFLERERHFFSLTLFTLLLQRLLNQNKHPAGYITRKEKRAFLLSAISTAFGGRRFCVRSQWLNNKFLIVEEASRHSSLPLSLPLWQPSELVRPKATEKFSCFPAAYYSLHATVSQVSSFTLMHSLISLLVSMHLHSCKVKKDIQLWRIERIQKGRTCSSRDRGETARAFLGSPWWQVWSVPQLLNVGDHPSGLEMQPRHGGSPHFPPLAPSISVTRVSSLVCLKTDVVSCCLKLLT